MWWTAPAPDNEFPQSDRCQRITTGSGPHANYNDRFGYPRTCSRWHGIDAAEKVVVRKQLRRSQVLAFFKLLPPCLIGTEACATAHYWARDLTKLVRRS